MQIDYSIKRVTPVGAQDITLKGCNTANRGELQANLINDSLYVTSAESVEIEGGLTASRNFIAKADIVNGELTCAAEINIPGRLLTVTQGSALVDDTAMVDMVTKKYEQKDQTGKNVVVEYKSMQTSRALVGLALGAGTATLTDEMGKEAGDNYGGYYGAPTLKSTRAGELVRMVNVEAGQSVRPSFGFNGRRGGNQNGEAAFEFIQVDAKGLLSSERFTAELASPSNSRLLGIEKDPSAVGKYLGLVQSGRKFQVVQWTDANKRPQTRKLVAPDEKLKPMTESDSINAGNAYYNSGYHFSPDQMSFEVAESLSGINQFFVK